MIIKLCANQSAVGRAGKNTENKTASQRPDFALFDFLADILLGILIKIFIKIQKHWDFFLY